MTQHLLGLTDQPRSDLGQDRTAAMSDTLEFCDDRYDRRKLLYHPAAIASLLETGDCWPVTVNTGFTTYCNHSCAWCSSAYTTRTDPSLKTRDSLIIEPAIWIRNMEILARGGTKGLIIAGQGEPLLHPEAGKMLEAAAGFGLRYMLFTNGERLAKKFYDAVFTGCLAVRFSVDAATPEMHQRWHAAKNSEGRGHANFERVVKNIGDLVAEKKRRGTTLPHVGCQMIASRLTENDFEGFASLFREIGVDYVVYKSLQRNESNTNISISSLDLHQNEEERAAQAAAMLETLLNIKRKYETAEFKVHVKTDQIAQAYVKKFNGAERYSRCRAHPLTPMIEPDGKVYICVDHGGNDEFVIGNIYEHTIDEIWKSERRQQVIERIDLKRKCPAGCFLDSANILLRELTDPQPSLHVELI